MRMIGVEGLESRFMVASLVVVGRECRKGALLEPPIVAPHSLLSTNVYMLWLVHNSRTNLRARRYWLCCRMTRPQHESLTHAGSRKFRVTSNPTRL